MSIEECHKQLNWPSSQNPNRQGQLQLAAAVITVSAPSSVSWTFERRSRVRWRWHKEHLPPAILTEFGGRIDGKIEVVEVLRDPKN